jgi:hypothetical protein
MAERYRTHDSCLDGTLEERMIQFLESLFGESQGKRLGGRTLRTRVKIGAMMEFGLRGMKISFPNMRSVRLQCGPVVAEIAA